MSKISSHSGQLSYKSEFSLCVQVSVLALLCFQGVSLTQKKKKKEIKRKVFLKSHYSGSHFCISKEEIKETFGFSDSFEVGVWW